MRPDHVAPARTASNGTGSYVPPSSGWADRIRLLAVLVPVASAIGAVELVVRDATTPIWLSVLRSALAFGLVVIGDDALARLAGAAARPGETPRRLARWHALARPRELAACVGGVGALAVVWVFLSEAVARAVWDIGLPGERLALLAARNVMVILAMASRQPRMAHLAVFLAAILGMASLSAEPGPATVTTSALALMGGLGYLVWRTWSVLRTEGLQADGETTTPSRTRTAVVMVTLGLLAALSSVFLIPTTIRATAAQFGLVPSSGGSGGHSPYARSGIGDGDALTAATTEAMSFAPLEDAPFLESNLPSLYDMFLDTYGEPPKPKKKTERAISIPGSVEQLNHRRMAEARKSGQTFTIDRDPPRRTRTPDDTTSRAVIHLIGRTPVHLRVMTYDLFDGREWFPEMPPVSPRSLSLVYGEKERPVDDDDDLAADNPTATTTAAPSATTPWVTWGTAVCRDLYADRFEPHLLKLLAVDSSRIPAPPGLAAVHLDQISDPSFVRWAEPDVLALDRETIPPLTIIRTASRVLDETRLSNPLFLMRSREPIAPASASGTASADRSDRPTEDGLNTLASHRSSTEERDDPTASDSKVVPLVGPDADRLTALAAEWTADATTPWEEVVAIRERLRTEYAFDRAARPPDGADPLIHFLFTSKRGPDTLFATAAAVLLRQRGIACRAVSGFHCGPMRFDPLAGQSSVLPEDVHWWVEVRAVTDTWITVESCPGFGTLEPTRSWTERFLAALYGGGRMLVRFWPVSVLVLVMLIAMPWIARASWTHLTVAALRAVWWLRFGGLAPDAELTIGQTRALTDATATIVARRLDRKNLDHTPGASLARRFRAASLADPTPFDLTPNDWNNLARAVAWSAHGGESPPPLSSSALIALARRAVWGDRSARAEGQAAGVTSPSAQAPRSTESPSPLSSSWEVA